jgi:phosphate ABC transporter phosphate-binding protein
LWSWLVTPGRLVWKSIVDNLADRAAAKMLVAATSAAGAVSGSVSAGQLAQTELNGAGAAFPAPLYQKWFEDFEQLHPGVRVRYDAIGSQRGIESLSAGKVDFAGSDVAPELLTGAAPAAPMRRVPATLGAVVAIYNLQGAVQDLHFTPEALAGIYLGQIHRWNDAAIRGSNKGVNLPDAEIVVVHRSEGSGTTWVWSNYLSKVSKEWAWTVGRGASLRWPTGMGVEGTEGVAETVAKTPNSIGYVELTYAIQRQLSFAGIRNRVGEFVHADLDSLAEAARSSIAGSDLPADITDPPGRNAYPIATFTWLLIPPSTGDPAKAAALKELLSWILTSGQKESSAVGYVPLPRATAEDELRGLQ